MPEHSRHDPEKDDPKIPLELLSALRRSANTPIFIPPTVDEAILRAARQHLSPEKNHQFRWPRLFRWSLASLILTLLLMIMPQFLRKAGSDSNRALLLGDLNHDGQVDILDAFALARELRSHSHLTPQLDINQDGIVDERDVTALAARAVNLAEEGHL